MISTDSLAIGVGWRNPFASPTGADSKMIVGA
jgi:hypothetical protein